MVILNRNEVEVKNLRFFVVPIPSGLLGITGIFTLVSHSENEVLA